jgi:hypothetical protein
VKPHAASLSRRLVLLGSLAPLMASGAEPRAIRLARPAFHVDPKKWYPLHLLEAAIRASEEPGTVRVVDRMTDSRALIELSVPEGQVDVVVGMPSQERDEKLLRVPVPLYKGLFGLRLLVVRRGEAANWRAVRDLPSLRAKLLLQGADWPDTSIMSANGLQLRTAAKVPQLYEMLLRGEGDAFPRGATEAAGEVVWQEQRVEIVPGLGLRYHTDLFFYVRRHDTPLAQQLQRGLLALNRSGALDRLLLDHHGEDLRVADLRGRRWIELAMLDGVDHRSKEERRLWTPPLPR